MPSLPVISREYLYINGIQAFDANSPDHATDPTTLPIDVALTARFVEPDTGDWTAAEWVNTTTARILTGAGGTLTPAAGTYDIWVRITGAVEQPEHKIGVLAVT